LRWRQDEWQHCVLRDHGRPRPGLELARWRPDLISPAFAGLTRPLIRRLPAAAEFPLYDAAAAHILPEAGGKIGSVIVACGR